MDGVANRFHLTRLLVFQQGLNQQDHPVGQIIAPRDLIEVVSPGVRLIRWEDKVATLLITSGDVGHLLDVDAIERHVNLVVLIDLECFVAFDLSCDPVGLHGVCEGDDLLAKVGGALDVDVLVVDWHACVVHG